MDQLLKGLNGYIYIGQQFGTWSTGFAEPVMFYIVSYSDWWIRLVMNLLGICGPLGAPVVSKSCHPASWCRLHWLVVLPSGKLSLLVNFHITDGKITLFNGKIYYNYGHPLQSKLWNCRRAFLLCSFHVASIMGFSDPLNCDLFQVFFGWPLGIFHVALEVSGTEERYQFHIFWAYF